ncbi:MAG: GNAT family N-acetyltransferase [Tissierellia bacterium]|nr:GNAT family N-acetyltransferase [Tissierellia bacterium]
MDYKIYPMEAQDHPFVLDIYNRIVNQGMSYQRETPFSLEEFIDYVKDHTVYVLKVKDEVCGFFILRPNGPGRVSHIANGTYGLAEKHRGKNLGKELVQKSLEIAKKMGYHGIQFNSVVINNKVACHLYQSFGFKEMAIIPKGYRGDGEYFDIGIYYKNLINEK